MGPHLWDVSLSILVEEGMSNSTGSPFHDIGKFRSSIRSSWSPEQQQLLDSATDMQDERSTNRSNISPQVVFQDTSKLCLTFGRPYHGTCKIPRKFYFTRVLKEE
jgi:hypothetical protein